MSARTKAFLSAFVAALLLCGMFAIPAFAFVDTSAQNVATTSEERPYAESKASAEQQTVDDALRSEQGKVSLLSTDTHNPYNGQVRLNIDIGSEFATFENSDFSEGKLVKVTPGGTVSLPKVTPLPGYYFVGWCQGGVPEDPTWDIFTEDITVDDDIEDGKNMTVYALYAAESGDGYCTCGAWKEGVYSSRLEQIKADNEKYASEFGTAAKSDKRVTTIAGVLSLVAVVVFIAFAVFALRYEGKQRKEDGNAQAANANDVTRKPVE